MNYKEEKYLNYVNERIDELLENNADKNYIADLLDDIIYYLPDDLSSELLKELYRIQDNFIDWRKKGAIAPGSYIFFKK